MRDERKRILLVDDSDVIRHFLGDMLRVGGEFDVDTAINGRVALDMLNKDRYNALLVDMNMPFMSGIELYRCVERTYPEMATKVVFMSLDIPDPKTRSFFTKVNWPFLLKPFTIDDLMNAFRNCVVGREAGSPDG